ncbi:MAG: hypothetical protein ACT6S0_07335 [Roseateles sp.]|uniref:hypothetical protein n=1 Tax=Roseateles sp. TaxID=1971397 RepID=UPI0040362180
MRDFPQELFIVLIFGAVWLAQLVFKQLRTKAAALQAEMQARAQAQVEPATVLHTTGARLGADEMPEDVDAAEIQRPLQMPRSAMVTRAVTLDRPRTPRFSRAALMRDRRAVQDAIVISAILQPCHAHRPHDLG